MPPAPFQESFDIYELKDDWRVLLERWAPEAAVFAVQAPLADELGALPGWQAVYGDGRYVVFVRRP